MAKIKAPNKRYTGKTAGIQFSNGEAETTNQWLIQWFKENGYSVGQETKKKPTKKEEPEK